MFVLWSMSATGCAYHGVTGPEVVDSDFAAAYRNDLKTLASDEFQCRKPGTAGGKITQEYLLNSFKSMGLKRGNKESYLQEVKIISSKSVAAGNTVVRSDSNSLILELYTHILPRVRG